MKINPLFLAIAVPAWLLVGCGDDDTTVNPDTDTTTTDTAPDASTDDSPSSDATEEISDDASADTVEVTEPESPLLAQVHEEVFAMSCGGFGCHLNGSTGGQLSLDDDAGLRERLLGPSSLDDFPLVTPGDPDASYLMLKIDGRFSDVGGEGVRMPSGGRLSAEQLALVEAWIAGGALE